MDLPKSGYGPIKDFFFYLRNQLEGACTVREIKSYLNDRILERPGSAIT